MDRFLAPFWWLYCLGAGDTISPCTRGQSLHSSGAHLPLSPALSRPAVPVQVCQRPEWLPAPTPAGGPARGALDERAYVEAIEKEIRGRQQSQVEEESGSWTLRDCYDALSKPEKSSTHAPAGSIPL